MKNMTQAWGWLTAGVLAAGLNASYHDGGLHWAHEIADHVQHNTAAVLALASGNATRFLSEAQVVTAKNEKSSCQLANTLARVQAKVASSEQVRDEFEIISDQEEAQLDRLEANRDRIEAQVQAQVAAQTAHLRMASVAFAPVTVKATPAPVVCPRIRVNVPRIPTMKMPATPEIHINIPSAGPV
ncbi:MAG: hypothetical protein ACXVZZ_10670 [Terriglobales bacterium]